MARVLLESPVPHLDREFDYLVPRALDARAVPGARVSVRFGGREMSAWLVERVAEPSTGARLSALTAVPAQVPPLTPEVLATARAVAERQAGVVADVLRLAVPPRVARVEREVLAEQDDAGTDHPVAPGTAPGGLAATSGGPGAPGAPTVWEEVEGGRAFMAAVLAGDAPRAAAVVPSRVGAWDEAQALASLAAAVSNTGGGVLLLVPDHRDLDRLCAALTEAVGAEGFARIGSEDGNSPRYRAHLHALLGRRRIVAGTRAAAWAPVQDLRLVVLWDDADDAWAEPRAPYFHTREVVLERARAAGSALLLAGPSRSLPVQRLVESGWLLDLRAARPVQRALGPRVVSSADGWESARDPFARRARLPHAAWQAAREALTGPQAGPVLVQVARAGFIPAVVCARCRTPARCRCCSGPLAFPDRRAAERGELACRWCGTRERAFRCTECGSTALRAGSRGVDRTAEELGRAFPQVPVHASSSEHRLGTVGSGPSLVVATVGAEPHTPGGYAAALLLDGDSQLQREGLDVPVRVLGRWLAAAALVRAAGQGGTVVVTAEPGAAVGALVRQDPAGFASVLLAERRELRLPPAGRLAEVTGEREAVADYLELVEAARRERRAAQAGPPADDAAASLPPLPWIGPAPGPVDETRSRALLLFPYAAAAETVGALRDARAAASARREHSAVRVRLDPAGVL
ncbi:primosomal protein N' [Micrococcus sp.]|uniref:primosomal protein N' family DNA-binding protein n=1 Tax=Micrococcus sp. TaxID=1271 RepID=UPI002A90C0AD|nr:primosomal protein N' [Micrococcus sp.]MDY6055454.1 primosomal protein N' [Micrococcus sp.]